MKLVC